MATDYIIFIWGVGVGIAVGYWARLKWAVTFRVTPVTLNVTACHIPCNTSQVVESDTVIVYPCGRARLDVEKLFAKLTCSRSVNTNRVSNASTARGVT